VWVKVCHQVHVIASELYAKQMHGSTISTRTEIVEDQKESLEAFCSAMVECNGNNAMECSSFTLLSAHEFGASRRTHKDTKASSDITGALYHV